MGKIEVETAVLKLIHEISKEAYMKAEWFPVDRIFISSYLPEIMEIDPIVFCFANLERNSELWSTQLFLCLPEVWMEIQEIDIVIMLENFNSPIPFCSLILFTHKFIGINILELIFKNKNINSNYIKYIIDYLRRQWNTLFMTDYQKEELEHGIEGEYLEYDANQWNYIKQRLLVGGNIDLAFSDFQELEAYLFRLTGKKLIWK